MKNVIKLSVCLLVVGALQARSIFTPISTQWDSKYILLNNKAFYAKTDPDKPFAFDAWAAGYSRSADCAYCCGELSKCCNCSAPLAQLIFGVPSFTLNQAFANQGENTTFGSPWVSTALIKPIIEYDERGAIFGFEWRLASEKRDHKLRYGVRGRLPVKQLNMNRRYTANDVENEFSTKDDVRRLVTETINVAPAPDHKATINNSFAYRLDFLSNLVINQTTGQTVVDYAKVPLKMVGANVTNGGGTAPVQVIYRDDGKTPNVPLSKYGTAGVPVLKSDGTGVTDEQRAVFGSTTSYADLAGLPGNQANLWVVPTVVDRGAGVYDVSVPAETLRGIVESSLNEADDSIIDYLNRKNLNFSSQRVRGLGDATLQLFLNGDTDNERLFGELNIGAVFPTGKKVCCPNLIFAQPLGNNGHYEVYPGFEGAWWATRSVLLSTDIAYHYVLKGRECIAGTFCGACVKNVGPCVKADISWRYLLFHLQASFYEPKKSRAGFTVGYELYYKKADKVCYCCRTAEDIEGDEQPLDRFVAQRLTHVVAHKAQAEFFVTYPAYAIFGGGDYVFAGKNAPKEIGCHAGILVEF